MQLSATVYKLIPTYAFGISRGVSAEYHTILLKLFHENIRAYGESFPSSRYEKTAEKNYSVLENLNFQEMLEYFRSYQPLPFQEWLEANCQGVHSLISGLSSLYYDYFGQRLDLPVSHLIGFGKLKPPVSSFTIGIDNLETVEKKIKEAYRYPVLKIKLGTDNDREIVELVRSLTDKPIRVDANEGWSLEEAIEKSKWLAEQNVEFIEQPLPAKNYDATRKLYEQSALPIIADEDCIVPSELPDILACYHGINIKLDKCGGITPAIQMISAAKTFKKKIMLGCMVESTAGIAPSAHLGGMADYLDLDGNLLLSNDPFTGPRAVNGTFDELVRPGLGVAESERIEWQELYS